MLDTLLSGLDHLVVSSVGFINNILWGEGKVLIYLLLIGGSFSQFAWASSK